MEIDCHSTKVVVENVEDSRLVNENVQGTLDRKKKEIYENFLVLFVANLDVLLL